MLLDRLIRFINPGDGGFFELFSEAASRLPEMAMLFQKITSPEFAEDRHVLASKIEQLEQANDDTAHQVFHNLAETFITPIDRVDIHYLIQAIDDVSDYIYACSRTLDWDSTYSSDPFLQHMSGILVQCTQEIVHLIEDLGTRKRQKLFHHIEQLHLLRREMEIAYDRAMEKLYERENDFKKFIKRRELYMILQEVGDKCQGVAHVAENIALTNVG
jgi:uncharacterized protein Yka (UPF0111/DUF47 family)